MNTGQQLWLKAKTIIPNGNMLLSKRAEMFLPGKWPAYFSKSSGSTVIDLDGIIYLDMSIMSVGTNSLGYSDEYVDKAVITSVHNGSMSTLNCPEEVQLAESLIALHPWADMVRFARSGGEANAIAIRIARAASGKDKVAFCGYHGWHDWYLSANLASFSNLDEHLLPGLDPLGVPKALAGTILPFSYNDLDSLKKLVSEHDIGVIKMEVTRSSLPDLDFLAGVRSLATDNNIVLIFDECTSGFRANYGGVHLTLGIEPDLAMFGKALGNGYAITAVVGKRSVMEYCQKSFISSTFWTERIGPSAGVATLTRMLELSSWDYISSYGRLIKKGWSDLSSTYNLDLTISGMDAIPSFVFRSKNHLKYKTLITQELLKQNILASNVFFASCAHTNSDLERYFNALDSVFKLIHLCENGQDVDQLLDGPCCDDGFTRLQ